MWLGSVVPELLDDLQGLLYRVYAVLVGGPMKRERNKMGEHLLRTNNQSEEEEEFYSLVYLFEN